ncbi:hypothetical protein V475_15195 [Sphingobium baderi LL03]|uniref:Iron transporter n=1 Tax=Sphingobium baderi LL03 TaxID=1114964 RepID=T0GHA9_9SPHN|nr:hypothetical protein L485_15235 [Sphingobium baderi LL03]KMS61130.1 hypothetical protein V475_15195 [Sphingobium baderi LL03]
MRARRGNRLSAWGRIVTAIPLGYAATSLMVMALARLLPGDRAQATVLATLLSFALYAALIVYVFAASSARKAFCVTLALGALGGGIAWLSIAMGGRV